MSRADREVVVGVAESRRSDAALLRAGREAEARGARLVAVHVWGFPSLIGTYAASMLLADNPLQVEARRTITDALRRVFGARALGVDVQTFVARGPVVDRLVEAAWKAELLVVGQGERRSLRGVLGRTVDEMCRRRAACPVLVVPVPLVRLIPVEATSTGR